MEKEKKASNFEVARYLAEKHGMEIPDEKIKEVARFMGYYPNVLLSNYKDICALNKMFKEIEKS